jgi:P-type Ca2+ transporter type 2C
MKWHNLSIDEILKTLNTDKNGLSDEEAHKRILKYGNNELVEEEKTGPLNLFIMQFMNILIILLIVAAIAAYFVGDTLDSVVIIIVVLLNAIVGFIQEYRAEKAMEKLKGLISTEAVVIRSGKIQKIKANLITLGDVVVLEEGDNIPADLRIIESNDLMIDESALTGEFLPVSKTAEIPLSNNNETKNLAFMEADVVSGRAKGVVVALGMDTKIGRIAEMIQEKDAKTPLQEKIYSLGKTLGLIAVVVCTFVFALQFFRGVPLVETFLTAVSLAVAAVPEGLPSILTLTLALGMQRMARSKAVVRKLLAVETLGSCTVICTDKTGTLTKNKMTVRESRPNPSQRAFEISVLCNNARLSGGKVIGDPTDGALLIYAQKNGYYQEESEKKYPRILEIPLDSSRKRMTTVNEINGMKYVFIKGAPEIIIERCQYMEGEAGVQPLTPEYKDRIFVDLLEMTLKSLRVLALAYKPIQDEEELQDREGLEQDLILVGLWGMMDPPREEAKRAVETCKKAGIRVIMITGDHKDTAAAIAREIGILEEGIVLTGSELDELEDMKFEDIVDEVQVYARVFPEQKVRIVEALERKDNIVAMTGDGVNDAPALKKAAIGVSMGTGTDVAKESSDMVLQDDNFATIVHAVKEGRTIFDNIRRFIKFQLSTNIGAILTIVSASIMGLPVPFNPIQILWINIIMDGPPAQSLGIEPPDKDIMDRKPEKENILPRITVLRIVLAGLVMSIGTLALYSYELISENSVNKATTIAFSVFVMFQIFNVFNNSNFFNNKSKGRSSNKFLLIAVVSSLTLQLCVVYLPALQRIFRTTSISLYDWILIVLVASIILVSDRVVGWYIK